MSNINEADFKANAKTIIHDLLWNSRLSDYYSNFTDTPPDLSSMKIRRTATNRAQYNVVNSLDGLEKIVALVTLAPNLVLRLTWANDVRYSQHRGLALGGAGYDKTFLDSHVLTLELENTSPLSKLFFIKDNFRMTFFAFGRHTLNDSAVTLHKSINEHFVNSSNDISNFAVELYNLVKPHLPK